MLNIRDKGVLIEIQKHCSRIEEKITAQSFSDFLDNSDTKDIVAFNLLQIGELSKRLTPDFTANHLDIPWKLIKGMRDHIVHGYGAIDFEIIYNTSVVNVKELNSFCLKVLSWEDQS